MENAASQRPVSRIARVRLRSPVERHLAIEVVHDPRLALLAVRYNYRDGFEPMLMLAGKIAHGSRGHPNGSHAGRFGSDE